MLDSSYVLNRTGSVKNDPRKNHSSTDDDEIFLLNSKRGDRSKSSIGGLRKSIRGITPPPRINQSRNVSPPIRNTSPPN